MSERECGSCGPESAARFYPTSADIRTAKPSTRGSSASSRLTLSGAVLLAVTAALACDSGSVATNTGGGGGGGSGGSGGLGLGADCSADDDCDSGFCADAPDDGGQVCSACKRDRDCVGSDETCEWSERDEYNTCQAPELASLGSPCTTDGDCNSDHCTDVLGGGGERVCSECAATTDCTNPAATCEWDASEDYYVCFTPALGALGEPCSTGAECDSGYCFSGPSGDVCSQCEVASDCNDLECGYDDGLQYARCLGRPLGDSCSTDLQCTSGLCNTGICSECKNDVDCPDGFCFDNTMGSGYWECYGGLGDFCLNDGECSSGFCFVSDLVCSECRNGADCGPQQLCTYHPGVGYAICEGTAINGSACGSGAECVSGFCAGGVCSDCETDADCDGWCVDDRAGSGYFVCGGGLGNPCTGPADCEGGKCFDVGGGDSVCSECLIDADCPPNRICGAGPGYQICKSNGLLGSACSVNEDCLSLHCRGGVCSQCSTSADCINECVDARLDLGYYVCTVDLGEGCVGPSQCVSGECFYAGAFYICSECDQDSDCPTDHTCNIPSGDDWAVCVAGNVLGSACTDPSTCLSGYCTSDVCSECSVSDDCPGGGTCTDNTGTTGYWRCRRGLGATCFDPADCNSGFCRSLKCSECAVDADCGASRRCAGSATLGYATCQGTGALGDACTGDAQCIPGTRCNSGLCSECASDGECSSGRCDDRTATLGYYACAIRLGWPCVDHDECVGGYCYNPGFGSPLCSECLTNAECSSPLTCQFNGGWAECAGTFVLGATCSSNPECVSGHCNDSVCSECNAREDCIVFEGGYCADNTSGVGYWVCAGRAGDDCTTGADCNSGFCYTAGGPTQRVCSGCETDADCDAPEQCTFEATVGRAFCH